MDQKGLQRFASSLNKLTYGIIGELRSKSACIDIKLRDQVEDRRDLLKARKLPPTTRNNPEIRAIIARKVDPQTITVTIHIECDVFHYFLQLIEDDIYGDLFFEDKRPTRFQATSSGGGL